MKKSNFELIVEQIDKLTQHYYEIYSSSNDFKALQGVERCIELKMKTMGFDGKTQPEMPSKNISTEITLDLTKL